MSETNPYQTPTPVPTDADSRDSTDAIRKRVSQPATALLIMASIQSVFPAVGLVSAVVLAYRGELGGGAIPPLIGFTIHFIFLLAIAIGAAKMGHLESYHAGRTAAVLSCIPGISPFILIGIPFGIWSLRLLNDPQVRAAFPDGPAEHSSGASRKA